MAKIIGYDWKDSVGDWGFAVVEMDDGTFGAAWVGAEPLSDGEGNILCPTDEDSVGDRTGVIFYDSRDGAECHLRGVYEAITATY